MQPFYFERGLVILRHGVYLEYQHRGQRGMYFQNPETCDVECITEEEFWNDYERQEIKVADVLSSPTKLILPDATSVGEAPIAIPDKYKKVLIRRHQYVEGIEKRQITRGKIELIDEAVSEIAREINDPKPPKGRTVSEWMKALAEACGDIVALLPKFAFRKKRERQDPDHVAFLDDLLRANLEKSVWDFHQDIYLPRLKEFNAARARRNEPTFTPISYRSLCRYRDEHIPLHEIVTAKKGRQEARRQFRMIRGHMPGKRPLDFVEIDHAKLRLWTVDDRLNLPLGRPWITAIRDRHTKMLLGFFLTFRPPSLNSVFRAIRHSLSPKVGLRQRWPELEHDWVAFGLGATYVSDNGPDFQSDAYRHGILSLNAAYEYCESHTPWHKPNIERWFFEMQRDVLESLPGQVYRGLHYHKDYDPKKDAVVRFSTLVYLLVNWAVDVHPFKAAEGEPRPIDLWMDGIGDAPPAYVPDPDALRIVLGLNHSATLCQEGLRFRHLSYANDSLHELYRRIYRKRVNFVVHEDNLGRIHVEHPFTRQYFEVENTRPDYAEGLSLYQHQYLLRLARASGREARKVSELVRFREELQHRVADDLAKKETRRKLELARFAGIDSMSVQAGEAKSVADNARLPQRADQAKIFDDVPTFTWGFQ